MYKILGEIEEEVVCACGMEKEKYLELLKEYSNESYVKIIQETTQQLITSTLKGKSNKLSVSIPGNLTPLIHCKAYRRFLAAKRQVAYIQRRYRNNICKDEDIAIQVYSHYNIKYIKNEMDRFTFILRRAKYAYNCNKVIEEKILEIEKEDNEIMRLIEEDWVIPDMEKEVIGVSDNELNVRVKAQLEYIKKFIYPHKESIE